MFEQEGGWLVRKVDQVLETCQGYQSSILTTRGEGYEFELDFTEARGAFKEVKNLCDGDLARWDEV